MIVSDQRKRVIIKEAALQTASASMQIAARALNTISYVSGEIDWRVEPVIKHYSIFEADPKQGYL